MRYKDDIEMGSEEELVRKLEKTTIGKDDLSKYPFKVKELPLD